MNVNNPKLEMLSCDSDGNMKFRILDHIIYTNSNRMFKWSCDTIDKKEDWELVKVIKSGLYYYSKLSDNQFRRKFKSAK